MVFKEQLQRWIIDAINDPEKKDTPCSKIAVALVKGEGVWDEIYTVSLTGQQTPKQIVDILWHKAADYCSEIDGQQQCILLAFYGESSDPGAKRPFQPPAKLTTGHGGLSTEAPTTIGMRQQEMRHMEAMMQQAIGAMGKAFEYASKTTEMAIRTNETLSNRVDQVMKENIECVNFVKEMVLNTQNEQHAHEMAQLEYQRKTETHKKWLSMLPMLVNTISGREIFPQAAGDTALMEQIADSLDADSIAKIAEVVKPELLGPLMARFEGVMKARAEKMEAEEKAKQLAEGGVEYDQDTSNLKMLRGGK